MTQLIVAIDTTDPREADAITEAVGPHVAMFKYGLEYFWAGLLPDPNVFCMIDAKLKDIPNTVKGAVANICNRFNAKMVTVHADGGADMIRAAKQAAGEAKVLAVTVLTSLKADDKGQLSEIGVYTTPRLQVLRLTHMALEAGADGVVCSGEELESVRKYFPQALTVVPGIRPAGSGGDDQSRIITPRMAADRGANYIVVGRPITRADDPAEAAAQINQELGNG